MVLVKNYSIRRLKLFLAGEADIVLAGGTENMSQAPYLLKSARWGQRMGNGQIVDYMVARWITGYFQ